MQPPSPTRARPLPQTAKQQRSAQRYAAQRASSGPAYGQFGAATHVDWRGREYRLADPGDETLLYCRHRIRRRSRQRRTRGRATPIGGRTGAPPGLTPSRQGGQWMPKWAQPGEEIELFRVEDQRLTRGRVRSVFAMPRSSTARIELEAPGLQPHGPPVADPSPYLAWVSPPPPPAEAAGVGGVRRRGRRPPSTAASGFPIATAESL